MFDLQVEVKTAFDKIIASGAVEAALEKKLQEVVTDVINNELRSFSDFGKQLSGHVKSALAVDFNQLKIPGYNKLILDIIERQVHAHTDKALGEQIQGNLAELFAAPPAEITVSKIVADFIQYHHADDDGCHCDGDHEKISLHIEKSKYGARWVSMDKESDKDDYRCKYRFGVGDDGKIFGLKIDDEDLKNRLFVGRFYSFERDLFQMFAAGTRVVIDAEANEIDQYYPGRD